MKISPFRSFAIETLMNSMHYNFLLIILLLGSCITSKAQKVQQIDSAYLLSMERWGMELSEGRKGYLKLTALCRVKKDAKTLFGTGSECDCKIGTPDIAPVLGYYSMIDGNIYFTPSNEGQISLEDAKLNSRTLVQLDDRGDSKLMEYGRLTWKIITRGDDYYIRAYDAENPAIDLFPGFVRYPLNGNLIFEAEFKYFDKTLAADVESRIGITQKWDFIGQLTFEYKGHTYSLDVSENGFTMVRDLTSGDETYGGGRYIYLDLPPENGTVRLDFNKLYNPPCAFSEYTTCLLPPRQNSLDFRIEAGELTKFRSE